MFFSLSILFVSPKLTSRGIVLAVLRIALILSVLKGCKNGCLIIFSLIAFSIAASPFDGEIIGRFADIFKKKKIINNLLQSFFFKNIF